MQNLSMPVVLLFLPQKYIMIQDYFFKYALDNIKGNNNKALYKFLLLHIHEVYYFM